MPQTRLWGLHGTATLSSKGWRAMPLHDGAPYEIEHQALDDTAKVWIVKETGESCSSYLDYLIIKQVTAGA